MTIRTKCTLSCDIGLKCTKQIMKTIEGPAAPVEIRVWAMGNGWHFYGDRDSCPECWKALHSPTCHTIPMDETPTTGETIENGARPL